MSVINMAKTIKLIHPESLIGYKVGNFYNSYGKDAYIVSYLFDYKIRNIETNVASTGFPKSVLPKVMAILERKQVNYIIIDTRNNYKVDNEEDYKDLNCYKELFEKAHTEVKIKLRIQNIYEALMEEKDVQKIRKIEELTYENRKV